MSQLSDDPSDQTQQQPVAFASQSPASTSSQEWKKPSSASGRGSSSNPHSSQTQHQNIPKHRKGSDISVRLSPGATDRVFPIRSVVSLDPTSTPSYRGDKQDGYFANAATERSRRRSGTSGPEASPGPARRRASIDVGEKGIGQQAALTEQPSAGATLAERRQPARQETVLRLPQQLFTDISSTKSADTDSLPSSTQNVPAAENVDSPSRPSFKSARSSLDDLGGLVTSRFKHIMTDGGHAIITGLDGEKLQRCEDEPIHTPGAVQGFGLLIALHEDVATGNFVVRIASENSKSIIGRTPRQLFALDSFTDILSEEQADNLLDHIDFIRDEDADVATNGPEVFTLSIKMSDARSRKLWCAIHMNNANPGLIICEFELEDDQINPLVPSTELTPPVPEDTLDSRPTEEEFLESTQVSSRPLRVLRSARKRKGEAAAMEVFNIMSQVQEQLAAAPNLDSFLKVLVGVVKELTGFHRVMIYQFDNVWNGRVVTELLDPRVTRDLYKGLNFPASDIPKQARDLYRINRVRLLYDRDQESARLVCRTLEDLETPLDLTHSYLRAMSPIHVKYLANMAVRSSMSISINAFDELWGLISCHAYGPKGMRVSFPIRKMCRLVGDSASRNIERLSYASRLQARKLINTVPTQHNPSGYIIASSDDLLKLFDADFGLLSIRDETKILGHIEHSQEALAMLEYLRMRQITAVLTSQDVVEDFPDLRYPLGFSVLAGLLFVPLSAGGTDFIVFFRKGQLKEVKWAGNPYEKMIRAGTEGYLEPRSSFKMWTETVVGKCREWTEEQVETAAVLCLVYGKFIEVWRQKEAALQNSQLTKLLLANSAHEVRTPLNAIINYLEIALEGTLDQETRENLARSHSASKSLIYVINDLLDLTKTEEGGDLVKEEVFEIRSTLREATDLFAGDARRKQIKYEVIEHPGLPTTVLGDQRRVRQCISNLIANAIQHTSKGFVRVEMSLASRESDRAFIEIVVHDSGIGMDGSTLDSLFRELEQVQTDLENPFDFHVKESISIEEGKEEKKTLGLGLAMVARIIRNMDGQLRLKSEKDQGSRFVVQLPFYLPKDEASATQSATTLHPQSPEGEITLVNSAERRNSHDGLPRRSSTESLHSRKSLNSFKSATSSQRSGMSDVDRLIEAIQGPHLLEERPSAGERSMSSRSIRSQLERRESSTASPTTPPRERARSLDSKSLPSSPRTRASPSQVTTPGQHPVQFSGTPIKPVKMPDEAGSILTPTAGTSGVIGEIRDKKAEQSEERLSPDNMHVLVAEDDPVNSRLMQKRLEKYGHEMQMTLNGEDCFSAYHVRPAAFDVVLMDMQMPIIDGLNATKMIRSFERGSKSTEVLSLRASRNGRIPIIAVSASLLERDKHIYIDAGFDGWILKPISFPRLSVLIKGIVDEEARASSLYEAGKWEKGGWFHLGEYDIPEQATSSERSVATSIRSNQSASMKEDMGGKGSSGVIAEPNESTTTMESHEQTKRDTSESSDPLAPSKEELLDSKVEAHDMARTAGSTSEETPDAGA